MSRKTKNLIWSAPLVAALAVVGALAVFMALEPNAASAQVDEVPGMPLNLKATPISPTSIDLLWDAPTDGGPVDSYRIDYSEDGKVWYALDVNFDSTAYTDYEGMNAAETRHYRVFAINSSGSSPPSASRSARTESSEKAGAPMWLCATGMYVGLPEDAKADTNCPKEKMTALSAQIKLTWDEPRDPEGAPVDEYRIEVSKNGRTFTKLEEVSEEDATCEDEPDLCYIDDNPDLLAGAERWYRVSAINSPNGTPAVSDASETAKGSTTAGAKLPKMTDVKAGVNPDGRMWLYWNKPKDTEGNPIDDARITGYYIYGKQGKDAADAGTDTELADVFFVGERTEVALISRVLSQFNDETKSENWYFQVAAVNSVVKGKPGSAEFSDPVGPVNNKEPKDHLSRLNLTARRDSTVDGGRTQTKLSWNHPKEPENNYRAYLLQRSSDQTEWTDAVRKLSSDNDFEKISDGKTISYTDDDSKIIAGTTYYYRVFATHTTSDTLSNLDDKVDDVYTETSRVARVTTAPAIRPGAPLGLTADAISETEIDLTWEKPFSVGDGKIKSYQVEASDDGRLWKTLRSNVPANLAKTFKYDNKTGGSLLIQKDGNTHFRHTGLMPGETKHYRVSAINNAPRSTRLSPPSGSASATTEGAEASTPPIGLVAKAKDHMAIELVWNAREKSDEAAPILGYSIERSDLNASDNCAGDWQVVEENTKSKTTSYTDSGLTAETGYCYRVYGIDRWGRSDGFTGFGDSYSDISDADAMATTKAAPPNTDPKAGDAIADQTVTAGEKADVDVAANFSDADADDTLTYTAASSDDTVATVSVSGSTVSVTGVAAGSATITVTATDAKGATAEQSFTVTVNSAELTKPTGVNASVQMNGISVTWDLSSTQNVEQVKVALFDLDADGNLLRLAAGYANNLHTINPAGANTGAHTFTNVPAGTYKVGVAYYADGVHKTTVSDPITVKAQ